MKAKMFTVIYKDALGNEVKRGRCQALSLEEVTKRAPYFEIIKGTDYDNFTVIGEE